MYFCLAGIFLETACITGCIGCEITCSFTITQNSIAFLCTFKIVVGIYDHISIGDTGRRKRCAQWIEEVVVWPWNKYLVNHRSLFPKVNDLSKLMIIKIIEVEIKRKFALRSIIESHPIITISTDLANFILDNSRA